MSKIEKIRDLLKKVVDDEESRPGAWGPDVTTLKYIQEALDLSEGMVPTPDPKYQNPMEPA